MNDGTTVGTAQNAGGWSIVWGILMLVCGIAAIAVPFASSIGITIIVGWLVLLGGIAHLVFAFQSQTIGGFLWKLLLAVLYGAIGFYMLMNPLLGLITLTLVLGMFLLVEACLEIILYFNIRPAPGSGWVLFDAIITAVLGIMIWAHWPASSAWILGTLVGISLIFSGISRIMLSSRMRRTVHAIA